MALVTYTGSDGNYSASEIGSDSMRQFFEAEGWLVLRQFFNPSTDYQKVTQYINHLIDLQRASLGLEETPPSRQIKTSDYLQICAVDRPRAGAIYRACRQLLPLHQMATSLPVVALAQFLMNTEFINSNPFTALRIDQRREQQYLFDWHQDYPYTQGSQDGIVIWGSLLDLQEGDGGIKFLRGSHRLGLQKIELVDPQNLKKNGAHSIRILNLAQFEKENAFRVDMQAGDVLVFSTLLLHKSIPMTRGDVRWTFQIRHGNFSHADAVERGWPGGTALGDPFEERHSEFVSNSSN